MIKVAICDDEEYFIQQIKENIIKIFIKCGIVDYKIKTYLSGIELCEQKAELSSYTIIFLDVNMKGQNGLETAKVIREYSEKTFLVFITAFIDYAPNGYQFEAMRYILKDMLKEMLPECIGTLIKKLQINTQKIKYDFIEGQKEIFVDDISYVESNRHKLTFRMREKSLPCYTLYEKLDDIEKDLVKYGFIRTHKSFLVNINCIKEVSNYRIKLKNDDELTVPRSRYKLVKETFFENKGELL